MAAPDFLVCLECETPCYVFEWAEEQASEALCEVCGNDEPDQFVAPEEFDALTAETRRGPSPYRAGGEPRG